MSGARTYTNPVYPGYFADPFVIEVSGAYYAYGTGSVIGDRVFEVLRSEDLVSWTSLGAALAPALAPGVHDYWAPEVVESDGVLWMYYSVGTGSEDHHIRAATATRPEGPFEDVGRLVDDGPFAIDAHAFRDDDGRWYLYYARDFLDGERVGTALVVDRLLDMKTVRGAPRTVRRATSEWQLFEAGREIYGSTYDWYTLEAPFVFKREGRYYCFYSGGSWERETYGVSFAVADAPLGPFHEPHDGPAVLRTVPGKVIGPGHCCVVEVPGAAEYLVYHAWDVDATARRMCIDRLEWGADGPYSPGPTCTARPAPPARTQNLKST